MESQQTGKPLDKPRSWQRDVLASLVVFLVALPLSMGIALASGAPIASGLITAIVGGLVVGPIAGSPLQVSGPAAGLAVLCGEVIRQHGLPALGIVVLMAGIIQIAAGILHFGQWFRAVSPAVVQGMLAGIGVLIVCSQLHVMVDDRPRETALENITSIPESILKGLPWPAWEDPQSRQSRLGLLQSFLAIHELQTEVELAVQRTVTEHGSEELHKLEEGELVALVPKQQRVLDEFHLAVVEYHDSPIAKLKDQRAAACEQAIQGAEKSLLAARDNLSQHRLQPAKASESVACNALAEVIAQLKNHDWAAKIGLLSIALIVVWKVLARGSLGLVPAPLFAVAVTTALAWLLALPVLYVEVPDRLQEGIVLPSWTVFEDVSFFTLLIAAATMAVIASAETLLCCTALDKMHDGPRTRYNQELAAQGFGNLLCGMVGALPMTGVIVRSATNVKAGATSRWSATLHGVWLLAFVLMLAPLLRMIPTAALAGILVYTGFKLIDYRGFIQLWRESRSEALIFLVTLGVIVFEDLLSGVLTGMVLSAAKLLLRFTRLDARLTCSVGADGRQSAVLSLSGAASFLRLPILANQLELVPPGSQLRIDFQRLDYIDYASMELLMNWARQHAATGGTVEIDWDSLRDRFRSTALLEHEPPETVEKDNQRHAGSAA